jgi:hypothetical protein
MIDMSMAQRLPTDPHDAHDEFASIEAAVAGTARGRWFLDEYVRRAQNRDNERIIATLTRIERMLTADAQTRQTQMPQPEMRQPEIRQRQPERSGGANFTPSISAPPAPSSAALASSPAHVPALAPAEQGAALPVLSALRAGGALDAPTPAPRPAPMIVPAAKAAAQSPARSLAETLEQALLATQPLADAAGSKPEARKPEVRSSAPIGPVASSWRTAAIAPRVADRAPALPHVPPALPYVPPAPALAPRASSPPAPRGQCDSFGPIPIDAKAFAHLEAMDAATRAKLFA